MAEKSDTALVMEILHSFEAGQTTRAIHAQTGIPTLVVDRVRKLQLQAPTLLIAVAAGNLSVTTAYQILKSRQAQPCV